MYNAEMITIERPDGCIFGQAMLNLGVDPETMKKDDYDENLRIADWWEDDDDH